MKRHLYGCMLLVTMALMLSCEQDPFKPPENLQGYELQVDLESVIYDPVANKVILEWNPPVSGEFSFYRVYVTSIADDNGNPVVETMQSFGRQSTIDRAAVRFEDAPGISDTNYFYAVLAVKVENDGRDTIEGALSNVVECAVLGKVNFSIDGGNLFTVTPQCNLIVLDNRDSIVRIRFTQEYVDSLKKPDGQALAVNLDDPLNPPDSVLLDTISKGWLSATGQIDPQIAALQKTPMFTTSDFVQPTGRVNSYPVELKKGNGLKRVWAEVTFKDGSIDILYDEIRIAPYRVKFKMRNEKLFPRATMRESEESDLNGSYQEYHIYVDTVKFSMSIFADSSFEEEFDYWLAFPDSNFQFLQDKPWYETAPRKASLKGVGAQQDDMWVYQYHLDPADSQGVANLSALNYTKSAPPMQGSAVKNIPFRLRGVEQFNENAIPGSYWGATPVRWVVGLTTYMPLQTKIVDSPQMNLRRLKTMEPSALIAAGKKEFAVIVRFKGRFFNDIRTAVSAREFNTDLGSKSYLDLYPPTAKLWDKENPDYATNNSIFEKTFSYALMQSQSVFDKGLARVESIDLIIALKPDSMRWRPDSTPKTLFPEDLLKLRHETFPYEIRVPKYSINGVQWRDIDPGRWPSGEYLMAIVTRDEFGNSGFAPVDKLGSGESASSNPWRVVIKSGN